MFNSNVRGFLDQHVVGPYQLDAEGARLVIEANEALPEEYFAHLDFPISPFWDRYFSSKIEIVPPRAFDDLLDVCCGTGTLCLNVMSGGHFLNCVAIDNSEVAIDRLRQRVEQTGMHNIRAFRDDVMRPNFEAESFDAIVGNSFLHHLPDNRQFLIEMHRLLRPGGVICFTGEPTTSADVLENLLMGNALRLLRLARIKRRPKAEPQRLTDIWLYEEGKLRTLLGECGYVDVTITAFGVTVPLFNAASAYLRTVLSRPSLQPDVYWKLLGVFDKYAFFWLPADWHSHFVISARKA